MIEAVVDHVAPSGTSIQVIDPQVVVDTELRSKFPLWSPEGANILAVDSSLAFANGLNLRPLSDSVDDVVEWWGERAWPDQWAQRRGRNATSHQLKPSVVNAGKNRC